MLKKQFLMIFAVILAGCSGFSLDEIDSAEKIVILPCLNFSGHELSNFPLMVYRDAELARLFRKVDSQTVNLSEIFTRKLAARIKNRTDNVVSVNEPFSEEISATNNYDSAFLQSIQQKHQFDRAYFCVITGLSMKNLFSEQEINIQLQLVSADKTGDTMHSIGNKFVIHVPDSAYNPLGVDLSQIINEFTENIIKKLLN